MNRIALSLASAAVAAASCLAVLYVFRGEPGAGPRPAQPDVATAGAPSDPSPSAPGADAAPAPDASLDGSQLALELARSADAREQARRDAILRIGDDEALSLDERLDRFRQAIRDARAADPEALAYEHPSMLAETFLRFGTVQRELAALGPAARSRELAHIRRELGYDEDAIARMQQVDERRDARWQDGRSYMQERARVTASFEGDAREAELRALRETWFGREAATIEAEERDGFYRFERPRIHGRN